MRTTTSASEQNIQQVNPKIPKQKNNGNTGKKQSEPHRFAGIETERFESSVWPYLAGQPIPLATVDVKLSGALLEQTIFLDRSALERVAVPVLTKVSMVFREMERSLGMAVATLKISKTDSAIAILATNILSADERKEFLPTFMNQLQSVADELKVVVKLAEMPADSFSKTWFVDEVRPDPRLLRLLKAALELAAILKKFKAFLVIDGRVIDLPCCAGLKFTKRAAVHGQVVGTLTGLTSSPARVSVLTQRGEKTVVLRVQGKGLIDELNQTFRVGDRVKITYEPVVDLLQEFEGIPRKGYLINIDHA